MRIASEKNFWIILAIATSAVSSPVNAPLYFEKNQGQTDGRVQFLARTPQADVFLTRNEAIISRPLRKDEPHAVLRMRLMGASRGVKIAGLKQLESRTNYFIGSDAGNWHRNIPVYGQVRYTGVYSKTDLLYYSNGRELEYDFILTPGANPRAIKLDVSGAILRPAADGDLVAAFGNDEIRIHKAVAYQNDSKGGKRTPVKADYVLHGHTITFNLGPYDRGKVLVIDPTITYSTYLGGSDDEGIFGIKFDSEGNIYVAGETSSLNFPITKDSVQTKIGGNYDCFISKFDSTGSRLIYSTYLGGSSYDHCASLALGSDGSAYVTGVTQSADFPVAHAVQPKLPGSSSGFVSRVSSDGSELIFSTYLGGSGGADQAADIALDRDGSAVVTGFTNSLDFPVTKGAYQTVCDGGVNPGHCSGDAFVTKINACGEKLLYSTYLGGSATDGANAIAVDEDGSAYITGQTSSTDFPIKHPYQKAIAGPANAYLTKLDPGGCALEFSTYLGGNGFDAGFGVAIDASKNPFVTGFTSSTNFPLENPYQSKFMGDSTDGFVTKFTKGGEELIYSTYLGGTGMNFAFRMAVDSLGNANIIGFTSATDFPVFDAFQPKYAGGNTDAFVSRFDPAGRVEFSSYLGGKGDEYGYAINADQPDTVWVGGSTSSHDFPIVKPFQKSYAGGPFDAFLTKISGH